MTLPALLGGPQAFSDPLPFARPAAPPLDKVFARLAPSYDAGTLTTGPLVRELEESVANRLGVDHVVAVANCTSGLMLGIHALAPKGPVLLPSFTFSASAHAISWNGIDTRFAECDRATFQLDLEDASTRTEGIGAIMATHVFGAPCSPLETERLAARANVPLIFDAAHGFGATHDGRAIGTFGDVEVFSMSPTKPLVAGEGGLVATNRAEIAEEVRLGRDYGNPGNYNTRFVGLNARLSELHAAVALCSLDAIDEHLEKRRSLANRYIANLSDVPGIATQAVDPFDTHTWKDFTISVNPSTFGINRDALVRALRADGIDTRNYFDPPVHKQHSHNHPPVDLPITDEVSSRVVSLPLYRDLNDNVIDRISNVIVSMHEHADQLTDSLS